MADQFDLTQLGAPVQPGWMDNPQPMPQPMPVPPAAPIDLTQLGAMPAGPSPKEQWLNNELAAQNQQAGIVTLGEPVGPRPNIVSVPSEPSAPPQALRPQLPAEPTSRPRGGAAGGFRSILAKEQAKRDAELQGASANLDNALQSYDEANKNLVQVQAEGLKAEARGASAQADAVEAVRRQAAEAQMLDEGERLLEQDAAAAKQAQIESGYERLAEMTVKDRRSPGEKMLAIASVALAGIGDSLMALGGNNNGQNADTALRMIDQQMQRSADEQLRVINQKREGLTAKERALKDFMTQVGDARAQRQYMIAQKWQELGVISEQVAANTQSEVKRNAAQQLGALAAQQSEAAKVAGAQAVAQDAAERARAARDLGFELSLKQSMGGGKGKPQPAAYGLRRISEGTDQDAKEAQKLSSESAGLMETLGQLREMATRGTTLSPTERKTAARRILALGPQLSNHLGSGAPSETELKAAAEVIMNPTEVNIGDATRFFDAFLGDVQRTTNAKMRPYGFVLDSVDVRPE